MDQTIKCTTNYEMFQWHNEQRELKPRHVLNIMASMRKRGFIPSSHIVVSEDFRILDGQHRFQAAKNLGLCVYYTIEDKIEVDDVREMAKTVERWTIDDYVSSHCKQGNQNYIQLRKLKEEIGLAWEAYMLANTDMWKSQRREFLLGKFVLTDRKKAEFEEFNRKFQPLKELFPKGWMHRPFIIAMGYLFSHKDFDDKKFKEKLEYQSTRLVKCVSSTEYVSLIESIYNYHQQPKHFARFLVHPGRRLR